MRGDMEEAVRFYDKALRIYPDFPRFYFLGLTYDLDFEDLVNAIYYYSVTWNRTQWCTSLRGIEPAKRC